MESALQGGDSSKKNKRNGTCPARRSLFWTTLQTKYLLLSLIQNLLALLHTIWPIKHKYLHSCWMFFGPFFEKPKLLISTLLVTPSWHPLACTGNWPNDSCFMVFPLGWIFTIVKCLSTFLKLGLKTQIHSFWKRLQTETKTGGKRQLRQFGQEKPPDVARIVFASVAFDGRDWRKGVVWVIPIIPR